MRRKPSLTTAHARARVCRSAAEGKGKKSQISPWSALRVQFLLFFTPAFPRCTFSSPCQGPTSTFAPKILVQQYSQKTNCWLVGGGLKPAGKYELVARRAVPPSVVLPPFEWRTVSHMSVCPALKNKTKGEKPKQNPS